MEPHRVPVAYSYHRSSMRTLPSHIATWSSKGTNIAPLENDDIHVHLHTLHFQSFHTRVISYPSHFMPKSFRTMLVISYCTHFSSSEVDQGSFTVVDLSGVRPSVRLFVCLTVCLSVNKFVDGPEFFSVFAQFDIGGNILTKFKRKSGQWSWRRCDNKKMFTDRRKDG